MKKALSATTNIACSLLKNQERKQEVSAQHRSLQAAQKARQKARALRTIRQGIEEINRLTK
jgi:hypothetical protein